MIIKNKNKRQVKKVSDFISVTYGEEYISLNFFIENEKIMNIGARMEKINPEAYMNGYNWEAFLNYYLEKNVPEILEGMDSDPESAMYAVYYDNTAENSEKTAKLAEIIEYLIENPNDIYEILLEHGDEIEWE